MPGASRSALHQYRGKMQLLSRLRNKLQNHNHSQHQHHHRCHLLHLHPSRRLPLRLLRPAELQPPSARLPRHLEHRLPLHLQHRKQLRSHSPHRLPHLCRLPRRDKNRPQRHNHLARHLRHHLLHRKQLLNRLHRQHPQPPRHSAHRRLRHQGIRLPFRNKRRVERVNPRLFRSCLKTSPPHLVVHRLPDGARRVHRVVSLQLYLPTVRPPWQRHRLHLQQHRLLRKTNQTDFSI